MSLFSQEGQSTNTGTQVGWAIAKKIHARLLELELINKRSHPRTWVKYIDRLLHTHNETQVKEVLRWFYEHANKPYTPKVVSGAQLYRKFGKLRLAMEQTHGPVTDVTPELREWVLRLCNQHKIDAANIPRIEQALQRQHDMLKIFLRHVYEFTTKDSTEVSTAIWNMRCAVLTSPIDWAIDLGAAWIPRLASEKNKWEIRNFVYESQFPVYMKHCNAYLVRYGATPYMFTKLERLNDSSFAEWKRGAKHSNGNDC